MNLPLLRGMAQQLTHARGHQVRWTLSYQRSLIYQDRLQLGACLTCDLSVQLLTKPGPDEFAIAGGATVMDCRKGSVRSTRNKKGFS